MITNRPKSLKQIEDVPDGYYFGTWQASTVTIILSGKNEKYETDPIKMDNSIRGFTMANIEVKDGWVYINN